MDDRRTFLRMNFPKWKGFFVHSFGVDEIQPVEALRNLEYLVDVTLVLRVSVSGGLRSHNVDNKYKLLQVHIQQAIKRSLRRAYNSYRLYL